jgi:hypothetical protein
MSRRLNVRQLIDAIPDKILGLKKNGYSLMVYDVNKEEGKVYDVTEEKQESGQIQYVIDTDHVIESFYEEGVELPIKSQVINHIIRTRVDFCKGASGSVSETYILGKNSGINVNDNVILLVNHSAKDFSSFIIGSANPEKSVKYFYIDIICGNAKLKGQASILLTIAINFITSVMRINVISLSALEHVISFYPKFGFMFIKDKKTCTPGQAVIEAMKNLNPEMKDGKAVGYARDEKFKNFLYLLTSLGFNSKNDLWCSSAASIGLSSTVDDVEETMKNPVSIDRESSLVNNESLMTAFTNYTRHVNEYSQEKNKPSPNSEILAQQAKLIIQYALEYASQLFDAGGCANDGFKMTRCAEVKDTSKKRKAESSMSTRSKRVR